VLDLLSLKEDETGQHTKRRRGRRIRRRRKKNELSTGIEMLQTIQSFE